MSPYGEDHQTFYPSVDVYRTVASEEDLTSTADMRDILAQFRSMEDASRPPPKPILSTEIMHRAAVHPTPTKSAIKYDIELNNNEEIHVIDNMNYF